MAEPAIRTQILRDFELLPPELQRRLQELLHTMVMSVTPAARHDVLRFAVDDPLSQPAFPETHEDRVPPNEDGPLVAPDARPEGVLGQLRRLIADGQVLMARRLAAEAADRFPDHPQIRNAGRILNGGEAVVGSGGSEPATDEEFEWLRNPPAWARGKWVALVGRKAVAAADDLVALVEALKPMDLPKKPLVHRVD